MLLSKSCVYGLRATLYLATKDRNEFTPIKRLSDKLEISFHFLTKILQQLTADGMLESFKGPNGGVRLTKPGDKIAAQTGHGVEDLLLRVEAVSDPVRYS